MSLKNLYLKFLIAICLVLTFNGAANAQVVRVGWYESPFNFTDKFGRRAGYAYDYQQKIAAYNGWTYEYVSGSWSELLQMLINGQIDLMTDVSYTPERATQMLYSSIPMGAETYCIFIAFNNNSISSSNLATLNGQRVGVNASSYQRMLFFCNGRRLTEYPHKLSI